MSETLTKADVQLHTGATPEKFAHMIRVANRGVPRLIDGPQEALCGYVFTPTGKSLPPCPACKAVFDDDEAMSLANP
jgi:hypothetical protein